MWHSIVIVVAATAALAQASQDESKLRKIYVTIGYYGSGHERIWEMQEQTNGSFTHTDVSYNETKLWRPQGIVVVQDWLYVFNWDPVFLGNHQLYRVSLSSGVTELVATNTSDTGGLAYDALSSTLYWAEGRQGCACIKAFVVDEHTDYPITPTVVYRAESGDFWKATAVALDAARERMFVSLKELDMSNAGEFVKVRSIPNTSPQGGITMEDADTGVMFDPVTQYWYFARHTYGAASGSIAALDTPLTVADDFIGIYHRDYQDVGQMIIDYEQQEMFFFADYYGGLMKANLDGSNATIVGDVPFSNPDGFYAWMAMPVPDVSKQACQSTCNTSYDCIGSKSCPRCEEGVCSTALPCNKPCNVSADCADSCPNCLSGFCRPQPKCEMECESDRDCHYADSQCTSCLEGAHGVKQCLRNAPTPYKPGFLFQITCLNTTYTSGNGNCSVVMANMTSGDNVTSPLIPMTNTQNLVYNALTVNKHTREVVVLATYNTSISNLSAAFVVYNYGKDGKLSLTNTCPLQFEFHSYDFYPSFDLFHVDPATDTAYIYRGQTCSACSVCTAQAYDYKTCKPIASKTFNMTAHCPTLRSSPTSDQIVDGVVSMITGSRSYCYLAYFNFTNQTFQKNFPNNSDVCVGQSDGSSVVAWDADARDVLVLAGRSTLFSADISTFIPGEFAEVTSQPLPSTFPFQYGQRVFLDSSTEALKSGGGRPLLVLLDYNSVGYALTMKGDVVYKTKSIAASGSYIAYGAAYITQDEFASSL